MNKKTYPCWAVGYSKKTGEPIITCFVTNEKESERAKEDYKNILKEDLRFELQKKEPFMGW
jgi:hypothetical protein